MASSLSPTSFEEEESVFSDVPVHLLHPSEAIEHFKAELRERLEEKQDDPLSSSALRNAAEVKRLKALIPNFAIEEKKLREEATHLDSVLRNLRLSAHELTVKKRMLEEENLDDFSSGEILEEIHELTEKVVILEKENAMKYEELKGQKKALIAKMCFYKIYLGIYIDVLEDDTYIFYFKRKEKDDSKPKEWIKICTQNFEEYIYLDVSLPDDSKGRSELLKLFENGIPLRKLILKARKLCLNLN